jgi:hypothetical protein
MTPVGGLISSCRIVKTNPIVIAEIVFESKEGADKVIETFNERVVCILFLTLLPPIHSLTQQKLISLSRPTAASSRSSTNPETRPPPRLPPPRPPDLVPPQAPRWLSTVPTASPTPWRQTRRQGRPRPAPLPEMAGCIATAW